MKKSKQNISNSKQIGYAFPIMVPSSAVSTVTL